MSTEPAIVVLDEGRLLDGGLDWGDLGALGRLTVHPRTAKGDLAARAAGAQVLLTNKTPLDRAALRALPDLRFVSVLATGHNVVDSAAARELGVPVSNVPSYGTDSVAQHVFALILELCNRAGRNADATAAGRWTASGEWCAPVTPVVELDGLVLGIIGRGRIAHRVAGIGRAFGLRVLMASPSRPEGGDTLAPMAAVIESADILTLHCQLTPATADLIDAGLLRRMKSSAFLINTARGGLVNETDLAAALVSGRLAGAALDVLCAEPPAADHPFCRLPNCVVTPHMAWMGPVARRRLIATTVENVRAFLAGHPVNVVN